MRGLVVATLGAAFLGCGARSPLPIVSAPDPDAEGGGATVEAGADGDAVFRTRDAGPRPWDAASLVTEDGGVVVLEPVACEERPAACKAQPADFEIQGALRDLATTCGHWHCYLEVHFDAMGCATRFVVFEADDGYGRDKPPPIAGCIAAALSAKRWDCAPSGTVVSAGNCGSM
jgi:hypothetical protein